MLYNTARSRTDPPDTVGIKPLILRTPNDPAPWLGDSRSQDVDDSRQQVDVGYDTDIAEAATVPLTHAIMAPPLVRMQMPASMMYPLRLEIADEKMKPMRMFPLRAEIERAPQ